MKIKGTEKFFLYRSALAFQSLPILGKFEHLFDGIQTETGTKELIFLLSDLFVYSDQYDDLTLTAEEIAKKANFQTELVLLSASLIKLDDTKGISSNLVPIYGRILSLFSGILVEF